MIRVYGSDTPNVFKVLIAVEEMGLRYERIPIDILIGEQFTDEFLTISPNNKVPAVVDMDPKDGGEPLSVFESGAILFYLAEKTGELLPKDLRERSEIIQWLMWQMAGQGPMLGQAGHFRHMAAENIPYAIDRYSNEALRLCRVLNARLSGREFLGNKYSIADVACWPWIIFRGLHGYELDQYPNIERWFKAIEARPAVKRAMVGFVPPTSTPKLDAKAREVLFGQRKI